MTKKINPIFQKKYYTIIFLISFLTLLLELLLTRIFSVISYYHFSFLAISLALLGLGSGGLFVFWLKSKSQIKNLDQIIGSASLLLVFSLITHLLIIVNIKSISLDILSISLLILITIISFLPFFLTGTVISLLLLHYPKQTSQLYFFDLLGAALGVIFSSLVLKYLGAVNGLFVIILLSLGVALISNTASGTKFKQINWALSLVAIFLFAGNLNYNFLDLSYQKTNNVKPIFSSWNAFSHVGVYKDRSPNILNIKIDANAQTNIYNFHGDLNNATELNQRIQALPHRLKNNHSVLVIGPGGGLEVIIALLNNAAQVTGVEVNPIIVNDIMLGEFAEFSSNLYKHPKVKIQVDEARSFIRRSSDKYDVIQASLVDTWAASATGAFSLTENNLYTVEAFEDYLDHLTLDGILSFTRWFNKNQPKETLRLVSLIKQAAANLGVKDISNHLIVISSGYDLNKMANLMFKKSEFKIEEIAAMQQLAENQNFEIIYSHSQTAQNVFSKLITTSLPNNFYKNYDLDVHPTTDNQPFFFFNVKPSRLLNTIIFERTNNLGILVLGIMLLILLALTVVFIVCPMKSWLEQPNIDKSRLVYFAGLGLGFMFIETAFLQKLIIFLGQPIYSLTVTLASILLFSGLGSLLTARISRNKNEIYTKYMLILLILLAALTLVVLPQVTDHYMRLALYQRIIISLVVIAPIGLLIGMFLPLGLKLLNEEQTSLIPWLWGINGLFSVLAAVVAILVAIYLGFNQVLILGILSYLLALTSIFLQKSPPEKP